MEQASSQKGNLLLVFSVLVGSMMIAAAIVYDQGTNPSGSATVSQVVPQDTGIQFVAPVTGGDHLRGNPDAGIVLIEFSDAECPFCKQFHATLKQVVDDYDGQVAWVYRHLPLTGIHPKAPHEAEATECAAALGGNDAFWNYLDKLFEVTPSNNGLDPAELPRIAQMIGLDVAKFNACLTSGEYASVVSDDAADAMKAGGAGTPYTIIIGKDGKAVDVIEGAQSYYSVRLAVEKALRS